MKRLIVSGAFAVLLSTASALAAPSPPATTSGIEPICKVGVYFADRTGGGVYRVVLELNRKPPVPANRYDLMVLTSHGAWRLPDVHLVHYVDAQELSIPDNGDIRAAWIASEGEPNEPMHECAPTRAFVVEGTDGIPKTKKELREQWAGGYLAKIFTHIALLPGVEVRNTGKPAGGAIAIVEPPCTEGLGEAVGALEKAPLDAPGPAIVVNVSPTGHVVTADVVRSFGSKAADDARLSEASAERFRTPPSAGCLAVPHRAMLTTRSAGSTVR
jgi:hypothetical protein